MRSPVFTFSCVTAPCPLFVVEEEATAVIAKGVKATILMVKTGNAIATTPKKRIDLYLYIVIQF
jgi:hypothetical protein